ncbi:MAG TPA: hypothetical protein PLV13_09300, partial [Ilumatobacteraceae bacterium]|nr:hypothetical protein [Ilumatobacteraceae bacterium]
RKRHPVAITFLTLILMAGSGVGAWFVARKEPPKVQYSLELALEKAGKLHRVEFIKRSASSGDAVGETIRMDADTRMADAPVSSESFGDFRALVDLDNDDMYIQKDAFPLPVHVETPWIVVKGDGAPVAVGAVRLIEFASLLPPTSLAEGVGEERVGDHPCVRWSLLDERAATAETPPLVFDVWVDKGNHTRKLTVSDRTAAGDVWRLEYTYTKFDEEVDPIKKPKGAEVTDASYAFTRS